MKWNVFAILGVFRAAGSQLRVHENTSWVQFLRSWICSPLKSTFLYVRMSFCSVKCWKLVSSPQNCLEDLCIQSCFPLLQGPSCRKSRQALFRSNWVKYDVNGKQLWVYLGECSDSFWGKKTNFQQFRGNSCERTERYFFNGLQIQLHKNWRELFLAAYDWCLAHPTPSHTPSGASLNFAGCSCLW